MSSIASDRGRLCYVAAGSIADGNVDFRGLRVETRDRRAVGRLTGFVVDPGARRLRFIVLEPRWRSGGVRLLVPLTVACLDATARTLRVDISADTLDRCVPFDTAVFREL